MEVTHEVSDGVLIIRPGSRIDSGTAAAFEAQCASLIEEGPAKVVIDFSSVAYISSAGLRALLVAAKKAKSHGGALTLCGLDGGVRDVMAVSGFDRILGAHEGISQARAALGA